MIAGTHWTKESRSWFWKNLLGKEEERTEGVEWAEYCQEARAVAIIEGEKCSGEIRVKGEGLLSIDDEYGVPYSRKCALEDVCKKVIK